MMPDAQSLLLFIGAGILLNLTPGVDMLYILGQAASRGMRAGILATAGVCAGCSVHIAAATLGVSALLASSATAFSLLKWIGAAYLIYLGIRLWLSTLARPGRPGQQERQGQQVQPAATPATTPGASSAAGSEPAPSAMAVFSGGFLTNALNPKVALFFLAFLPQFIAPAATAKSLTMLGLGVLFVVNSFVVNVLLAVAVSSLARRLGPRLALTRWLQRLCGSLFLYFGLRLLSSRAPA